MNTGSAGRFGLAWALLGTLAGCTVGGHLVAVTDGGGPDVPLMIDAPPDVPPPDVSRDAALPRAILEITPSDPVIDLRDGEVPAVVTFVVTARSPEGDVLDVTGRVRFGVLDGTVGTVDFATGTFRPTGIGGVCDVQAELDGYLAPDGTAATVSTTVTVRVWRTVLGPGASSDAAARFGPTDPDVDTAALDVLYPLANTVMPRNVPPPDIQWRAGFVPAIEDLYRLRFTKSHLQYDIYFTRTPDASGEPALNFVPDALDWFAVASADIGEPMTVSLQVLHTDGTRARADLPMTIVDALIGGTIWSGVDFASQFYPGNRGVWRIDFATGEGRHGIAEDSNTPYSALAVSRDGRQISVYGSADAATHYHFSTLMDPPVLAYTRSIGWPRTGEEGRTFSPDRDRLVGVMDHLGETPRWTFELYNGNTGAPMPSTGLPNSGLFPDWSLDGRWIAYMSSYDARPSGVWIMEALPGDAFGPARMFVDAAAVAPETPRAGRPSISPDSDWVAFQLTNSTFQLAEDLYTPTSRGDLWLASPTTDALVRLANAGTGSVSVSHPRFSPFDSGGYYWLVFSTARDYGHHTGRIQMWVTAVRSDTDGTIDPSTVPFWLPGQNLETANIDAFWVPTPCNDNGADCTTGNDCCSGSCDPDTAGLFTCQPRLTMCAERGETCSSDADCCATSPAMTCNAGHLCDYTVF